MTENLLGFVNIIKPTSMTSSEVVLRAKKILKTKKVGHFGTLDPAASGVLPLGVGKATRFFDYFLNKDKVYIARVKFGIETDTFDSFGNITKKISKEITKEDLQKVINEFKGEIYQTPPKFSALKIDGKKAYELARQNVNFELKQRIIAIFDIKLIEKCEKNDFLFLVHCSAGTYIRTLFSDIAKRLETISYVPVIIRTKSGNFKIEDAQTLEEFEKEPKIVSIENLFPNLKIINLPDDLAKKVLNGVKVSLKDFGIKDSFSEDVLIKYNGQIVGLFEVVDGYLKAKIFLYEVHND